MGNSPPTSTEWRKSSRSGTGNCVEVSIREGSVLLRDSKAESGPVLMFGHDQWRHFLSAIKTDDFGP